MTHLGLYIVPLVFLLLVAPILIARRKRGVSTWFPAQIIALFGLVIGIAIQNGPFSEAISAPHPLVLPIVCITIALGLVVIFFKR